MKSVLIISHDPLIKRIEDSFEIPFLLSKGISVTYLDISNFFYPNMISNPLRRDYAVKLNKEEEIINFIKKFNNKETLIISEVGPKWKSRHLYRFLNDNHYKTIKISIYGNSSLGKASLLNKFRGLGFFGVFKSLSFKIYKTFYKLKIWDEILTSTTTEFRKSRINHPDFEKFQLISKESSSNQDSIVFLDEYFPNHPEIRYWNKNEVLPALAADYYEEMRSIFEKIEKLTQKRIIIAAHPKAEYSGVEFGGRKIIKGNTAELVHNSAFVLMHSSMSASFAILFNKPIIMLTTPQYNKNLYETLSYQRKFSQLMGLPIFDTHNWMPQAKDIRELDSTKRNAFIYRFLTSVENENLTNKEIIYNYIIKQ